jgi:small subunit ribosomal protein S19
MSRSKWKSPYIKTENLQTIQTLKKFGKDSIYMSRDSQITPKFLNLTFKVHNGKICNEISVTEDMIGHKFGEFSFTRKKFIYKKKNK